MLSFSLFKPLVHSGETIPHRSVRAIVTALMVKCAVIRVRKVFGSTGTSSQSATGYTKIK